MENIENTGMSVNGADSQNETVIETEVLDENSAAPSAPAAEKRVVTCFEDIQDMDELPIDVVYNSLMDAARSVIQKDVVSSIIREYKKEIDANIVNKGRTDYPGVADKLRAQYDMGNVIIRSVPKSFFGMIQFNKGCIVYGNLPQSIKNDLLDYQKYCLTRSQRATIEDVTIKYANEKGKELDARKEKTSNTGKILGWFVVLGALITAAYFAYDARQTAQENQELRSKEAQARQAFETVREVFKEQTAAQKTAAVVSDEKAFVDVQKDEVAVSIASTEANKTHVAVEKGSVDVQTPIGSVTVGHQSADAAKIASQEQTPVAQTQADASQEQAVTLDQLMDAYARGVIASRQNASVQATPAQTTTTRTVSARPQQGDVNVTVVNVMPNSQKDAARSVDQILADQARFLRSIPPISTTYTATDTQYGVTADYHSKGQLTEASSLSANGKVYDRRVSMSGTTGEIEGTRAQFESVTPVNPSATYTVYPKEDDPRPQYVVDPETNTEYVIVGKKLYKVAPQQEQKVKE